MLNATLERYCPEEKISFDMAFRNQTKIPKLCLVYFHIDQTTRIVETKKLRSKDSGEPFSCIGPKRGAKVAVKCTGKLLDAMVIASDGKLIILSILGCFDVNWVSDFVFYIRQGLTYLTSFQKTKKSWTGRKDLSWKILQTATYLITKKWAKMREALWKPIQTKVQKEQKQPIINVRYVDLLDVPR